MTTPEYALGADNTIGIDYLLIKAPASGTWTFTPATGSSETSIQSATALPAPSVKGTRLRHGPEANALAGTPPT